MKEKRSKSKKGVYTVKIGTSGWYAVHGGTAQPTLVKTKRKANLVAGQRRRKLQSSIRSNR